VFAAYVSGKGHAFIDRALYLPKDWTSKPARMTAVHVPDDVTFATKPALACAMIERCIDAGVPFRWVAADSVYGVGDVEQMPRKAGIGYVLGVKGNHQFRSWMTRPLIAAEAKEIAQELPDDAWRRLSAGTGTKTGTKGERLYDWAYCPLADLDAGEFGCSKAGLWTRGLLIRRAIADGDCAYFTTWCPKDTSIETLVKIEGTRWRIEEGFETAKNEFGLDHNETRSWHGWHRHVSLVMLAYAIMAAVRYHANASTPKKTTSKAPGTSSAGSRKSAASP